LTFKKRGNSSFIKGGEGQSGEIRSAILQEKEETVSIFEGNLLSRRASFAAWRKEGGPGKLETGIDEGEGKLVDLY